MSERNVTPLKLPFKVTPPLVIIAIIIIVVLTGISTSVYTVGQQEEAVILFFGKKRSETVGPGLHFKLPFGIEVNYNVPTERVITQEFGYRSIEIGVDSQYSEFYPEESEMLTADKNIIDVQWNIRFRIIDPVAWLFNVEHLYIAESRVRRSPPADSYNISKPLAEASNPTEREMWYEKTIRDISQSIINQLVGDREIYAVVTGGSGQTLLLEEARQLMNDIFDKYEMGIRVTNVALRSALPPLGRVRDAFEDVNKAEQDAKKFKNEGLEEKNKQVALAAGTKNKIIAEAQGYAEARKNIAAGDVARFEQILQEYRKAPEVTKTRMYIEMWEDVFGESSKSTDLIDKNIGNFLPFKQLQGGVQ
ncbi:MAG: FtsH protease activity modulator HflK [Spirochaetales bacterium]|nr:FtsH protease activity modulator HflK [Spirochaetales bacterium]